MFFWKVAVIVASATCVVATVKPPVYPNPPVKETTCNGKTYTYRDLVGYGTVPGNATDKFGDTLNFGSALALDRGQWKKLNNGSYTGVVWAIPDRGWNTEGTLNFQPRVHKFDILFTPHPEATVENPSGQNLFFTYKETIRLYGPDGTPCTGLDADATGFITYPGFPELPVATYVGNGFGGPGPGGKRIPVDPEGIIVDFKDGSFWISDEYGPLIYHFDKLGHMIGAISPPAAYLPMRNGSVSFSADSPPYYEFGEGDDVIPADGPSGRNNNHGFEGMTVSGDGKQLYALLQAATNQEGGLEKQTERYARLIKYDITIPSKPRYAREYVVPLPLYNDPNAKPSKNPKVAAQSEIFHIQNGQFFVLSRDGDAGHGAEFTESQYRHIDVFDVSEATDIKGKTYDCADCSIASKKGVLKAGISPAEYCSFIDFNLNSQLNRFGVHNGGAQDAGLLNEKWESIGIVPVDGLIGDDDEWFVLSISDNDFITQNGFMNGGTFPYADGSGYNLDNQALMFHIKLPDHSRPFNWNN